jgi:hypothetical protein
MWVQSNLVNVGQFLQQEFPSDRITDIRIPATPKPPGKTICSDLIHIAACATHDRSSLRNGKTRFHPVNDFKTPSSCRDMCCSCRDNLVDFRSDACIRCSGFDGESLPAPVWPPQGHGLTELPSSPRAPVKPARAATVKRTDMDVGGQRCCQRGPPASHLRGFGQKRCLPAFPPQPTPRERSSLANALCFNGNFVPPIPVQSL